MPMDREYARRSRATGHSQELTPLVLRDRAHARWHRPQPPPDRLVHQYLEVRISPDAAFVAAVEGDSPPGGYYPVVRDLVIRRSMVMPRLASTALRPRAAMLAGLTGLVTRWKGLSFTVRTPGSHNYGLYRSRPTAAAWASSWTSTARSLI